MQTYNLAFKPAIDLYGKHDPSAVLFENGVSIFGIEEERLTRDKHAVGQFPENAIRACLDYRNLKLGDIDAILIPYDPRLRAKIRSHYFGDALRVPGISRKLGALERTLLNEIKSRFMATHRVEHHLAKIGTPIPSIELISHHLCHAASAFHPSGFDEALVLTIDAKGEHDSTVVWHGTEEGLQRLRTYEYPNSLGQYFAIITEYLGYRMFNGEGKVMGLAAYGDVNPAIESIFRDLIETGVDYDVTALTGRWGTERGVQVLEEAFDRPRKGTPGEFDRWEKDFAYAAQKLLEETVLDIATTYLEDIGSRNVAFAGGVALNCKLNKCIRELDEVDTLFVQPVAHDAGLALGAGWVSQQPSDVAELSTVYLGPEYTNEEIETMLDTNKLDYATPKHLERYVAQRIADGALVGWFQGRLELGPRALGARSILADPRTIDSRDRVNKFVKHRENWRPFAPTILEEAATDYFVDGASAPFMINAYDVYPDKADTIAAVIHPADGSTRPQTIREDQHPRYYRLIDAFNDITGVPVVLNTSFNDNGEPIVNTPIEAIKDFYGMGLDVLVLEDYIVEKTTVTTDADQCIQPSSTIMSQRQSSY